MSDYEDEETLDAIIDALQGINDAADVMNERSTAVEAAALHIRESADGIASTADKAADAAAAKVSGAAADALADFERRSATAVEMAAARAFSEVRSDLDGLRGDLEAARKGLRRLAIVFGAFMAATLAATYAVTSEAVEQVGAANASIQQTNELVKQVNDALGLALPQVQPIGTGLSAAVLNMYNGVFTLIAVGFGIWLVWVVYCLFFRGRRF